MIVFRGHCGMLIGSLKTKVVLEVFHHVLDICLGSPCHNIIVSFGIFDMIEISS